MSGDSESSDAVRMRRVRLHKKGDHSQCTARNCPEVIAAAAAALAPPAPAAPAAVDGREVGGIELAVVAFVESLPYSAPDPRALLAQIAVRLAQRVDETGAVPAAVRELRTLLMQLTEVPNGPAGPVDEVRLRAAQRNLDSILARAGASL